MDGRPACQNDSGELLDVFKAAALSVTRLYKQSVAAETKARAEGYQDCLDDLVAFLEREGRSLGEGPKSTMKKWVSERREGRDASPQTFESEDEVDKAETNSPPEPAIQDSQPPAPTQSIPNPPAVVASEPRPPEFLVPTQENFTFQSEHQYPNIELLDLSDARSHVNHHPSRSSRTRGKPGFRASVPLGRGAGTKRRMDFDDLFGGCFGGKDPFGGNKRTRHT